MAKIVNLNRVRKARAKTESVRQAEINRARHGRTKAARATETADQARRDALLDGARREE